jgi:hypothetical protein
MEAERSRIEQDLAKVKAEQDELGRQAELRSVKDLLATISSERAQIIADSTLPADLGTSAKGLEERAKASLDAVQKAVNAKQELPSTVDTAATLTAALQSLKDQREDAENKTSAGLTGILRTGKRWGKLGLIAIILLGSAILGGSIVANAFVDEVFWGIRLYYFVYGALGFPLSLLYGIIRPPIWQATILPWSLDENPDVVFSTNYFSYHLFTEEELTQAPPSGTVPRTTLLESGRAMLRWLSMGGLISSAIATYVAVKH